MYNRHNINHVCSKVHLKKKKKIKQTNSSASSPYRKGIDHVADIEQDTHGNEIGDIVVW